MFFKKNRSLVVITTLFLFIISGFWFLGDQYHKIQQKQIKSGLVSFRQKNAEEISDSVSGNSSPRTYRSEELSRQTVKLDFEPTGRSVIYNFNNFRTTFNYDDFLNVAKKRNNYQATKALESNKGEVIDLGELAPFSYDLIVADLIDSNKASIYHPRRKEEIRILNKVIYEMVCEPNCESSFNTAFETLNEETIVIVRELT